MFRPKEKLPLRFASVPGRHPNNFLLPCDPLPSSLSLHTLTLHCHSILPSVVPALIRLPDSYHDLFSPKYRFTVCVNCGAVPDRPALCLICGQVGVGVGVQSGRHSSNGKEANTSRFLSALQQDMFYTKTLRSSVGLTALEPF